MFLDWAKDLPDWLSDALRRLCQASSLSDADREEILLMGLAQHGLLAEGEETPPQPAPLHEAHLNTSLASSDTFVLHRLKDVAHVNALAPGQELEFATKGITTIFGENGSGKSGYARLFKNACRSRHTESILGNMHSDETGTPSAKFEVSQAADLTAVHSELWSPTNPMPALSTLAMYDGRCGRALLDEENDIAFSSDLQDAASAFAELWNWLTDEFEQRAIAAAPVSAQLSLLEQGSTPVARAIALARKVGSGLDIAALEAIRGLSEDEKEALSQAQEAQGQLRGRDHTKTQKVERLHATTHAERFKELTSIATSLGGEKATELRTAIQHSRATAEVASKLLESQAAASWPLPGVGSDPWRVLYSAARTFSSSHAYPEREFPQTEEGDRCPYCMQELDDAAQNRLRQFDQFMTATVKEIAEQAAAETLAKIAALSNLPASDSFDPWLNELAIGNEKLAKEIHAWLSEAKDARRTFEKAAKNSTAPLPESISLPPGKEAVDSIISCHTSRADAAAKLHDPDAFAQRDRELTKLIESSSAREQLEVLWEEIEALYTGLQLSTKLRTLATATTKRSISTFAKNLAAESLTKPIQQALTKELDALGFTGTRPILRSKGKAGSAKQVLALAAKQKPTRISDVLSEGEQRVISLALFLAEVQQAPGHPGIILDDPVSSLDDEWLNKIARRLVLAAKERQVIVFTHNIAFLLAIEEQRKRLQIAGTEHTLLRDGQVAGYVTKNQVWGAMSLNVRIRWLANQQQKAAALHRRSPGSDEYILLVSLIADRTRATWERFVEEGLFANTVMRYRSSIETNKLKSVVLTDGLFKAVYWGMTNLSAVTEAHDSAAHGAHAATTPDDIQSWIDSLRKAEKEMRTEATTVRKARDALLKVPR